MRSFILYGVALVAISFPACDSGSTITDPADVVFPDANVSFNSHVLPLFDLGCAYSGCHNELNRAGGVSLYSYVDVLNSGTVLPGDTTNSRMSQTMSERLVHIEGGRITLYATPRQRRGVTTWILEGARNN